MFPLLIGVVAYTLITAALSIPFMLRARSEFRQQGKWSPLTAAFSGLIMHGHFVATIDLAWLDRGSLFAPNLISLALGEGSSWVAPTSYFSGVTPMVHRNAFTACSKMS